MNKISQGGVGEVAKGLLDGLYVMVTQWLLVLLMRCQIISEKVGRIESTKTGTFIEMRKTSWRYF